MTPSSAKGSLPDVPVSSWRARAVQLSCETLLTLVVAVQHRLFMHLGLRGAVEHVLAMAACLDTSLETVHAEHNARDPLAVLGIQRALPAA